MNYSQIKELYKRKNGRVIGYRLDDAAGIQAEEGKFHGYGVYNHNGLMIRHHTYLKDAVVHYQEVMQDCEPQTVLEAYHHFLLYTGGGESAEPFLKAVFGPDGENMVNHQREKLNGYMNHRGSPIRALFDFVQYNFIRNSKYWAKFHAFLGQHHFGQW